MLYSASGLPYLGYGGLDSLNQLMPLEIKEKIHAARSNRRKKHIFKISMWGAMFHLRLVHLVIALKPGYSRKDLNYIVKRLFAWSRRFTDENIQYRASWVFEDGHVHVHILTTMPFIDQAVLVEKVEAYLGDNAHVYIKLLKSKKERKIAVSYLMQYVVYQDGDVHYTSSRGWLPDGAEAQWEAIKTGLKRGMDDGIFSSQEWREKAIAAMDEWIKEKRGIKCQRKLKLG